MDEADRLVQDARLDARAGAVVTGLSDDDAAALATLWDDAVRTQDRDLQRAVDGALSMVPKVIRRQLMKVLSGSAG